MNDHCNWNNKGLKRAKRLFSKDILPFELFVGRGMDTGYLSF
jgi:hypothetical protein